ncbi:hypothetical protein ACXVSK_32010 [Pseudomonas aeruginosa]|uniref:hypothetical protein n=1 Tax=Pseudomonas aeruginosa TaxID=287 RepID=UPI0007C7493B|nr:hypothetical protein [Pseudomonas aeruginosa]EKY4192447.1 hypothetical protein [Pseudomonas aeruginosa]ELL1264083.1 hypothetical protein [Pseudomonas aeruginosa]ELT3994615.1 hypothetical protein [Pseudomonas aeruginosa]MBG4840022.1 hypothetical protein [Pseudomonas aeruginosa]MBH3718357.1 hypothetical protein [Pseudomonas aeruginosa]
MPYFTLEEKVDIKTYPFDYHNHFSGVLPLESDILWQREKSTFNYESSAIEINKNQELSLIGLILASYESSIKTSEKNAPKPKDKAHIELFKLALDLMIESNPFKGLRTEDYIRGECVAENIYLACSIIQHRLTKERTEFHIETPHIYQTTKEKLVPPYSPELIEIIKYFNRKIWSGNKYTPFDDAYWARGVIRKKFPLIYNSLTLCFLLETGTFFTQTAMGASDFKKLNSTINEFNKNEKTAYRILAHTAHSYTTSEQFLSELKSITDLFSSTEEPNLLAGIDLLGAETKTGFYELFFEHMIKSETNLENYLKRTDSTKKIVLHIHCGEGTGISESNRSLTGSSLYTNNKDDTTTLSSQLFIHAITCYKNALRKSEKNLREQKNLSIKDTPPSSLSGLFDELFHTNKLIIESKEANRFNITSETTQSLTSHYAKTNIINLCQAFEKPYKNGKSYYEWLTNKEIFTIRIGHAYYYRPYIAYKFPKIHFDTNLGSNFITGSSTLFSSSQEYKINRGLRHLNGYIETEKLRQLEDRLFFPRPHEAESAGHNDQNLPKTCPPKVTEAIYKYIKSNPFFCTPSPQNEAAIAQASDVASNWRSYILGADGQGVEHSNMQHEFIRMIAMLTYRQHNSERRIPAIVIEAIQDLLIDIAKIYWEETIGPVGTSDSTKRHTIEHLEGFIAPHSIIHIKTKEKPGE